MQKANDLLAEPAALRHRDKIVEVVARAEHLGRAGNQDATHAAARAGIFDRRRHRPIHCKRERVLLVGPVHPDFADRSIVADQDIWHSGSITGIGGSASCPRLSRASTSYLPCSKTKQDV